MNENINDFEPNVLSPETINVLTFLTALPKIEGINLTTVVPFKNGNGVVGIDYQSLNCKFEDIYRNRELITQEEDRKFLDAVVSFLGGMEEQIIHRHEIPLIKPEYMSVLAFLAHQKDRIDELFTTITSKLGNESFTFVAPTLKLVEELLNQEPPIERGLMEFLAMIVVPDITNLPATLVWRNLDIISEGERGEAIAKFPEEFIATLSPTDQKLINFIRSVPILFSQLILDKKEDLDEYIANGVPTAKFFEKALIKASAVRRFEILFPLLDTVDLEFFTQSEKVFWEYCKKSPKELREFLVEQKARFSEFVIDGKETAVFYQALATDESGYFVTHADQVWWKLAFGREAVNKFLDVLPQQTDEKRNAFTHNEYDRTTEFIKFLLYWSRADFGVNAGDLEVLTSYVSQFGLARNQLMFHCFKKLYLFEQQKISELPQDIEAFGIRSVQEMKTHLTRVREMVYSGTPLTDLSQFSNFEIQMLSVITGKSTHRFDGGKEPIEIIMRVFQQDMEAGSIAKLPRGYRPEVLDVANVRIEFNADEVKDDYEALRVEILASIQNPNDVETLTGKLKKILQRKIEEIETVAASSEGKKREFIERERERFLGYSAQLGDVKSLDSLTSTILDINFDKTEQRLVSSIVRRIIFSKVFQKHFSGGFIQEIQMQLEGEPSAASLETVINIIDEMGKTHVFNLKGDNQEGYWDEEVFRKVRDSKRGRDLPNCFSPHINKLKEAVRNFEKIQEGENNKIAIIPDRGFVGEMSGYLADACYTAEYPLLKKWPNVVPYKFVMRDPDTQELRFIGSVLVFEVSDAAGNPSLLVRAFDVPQESTIDIDGFIEQFLDKLVEVGKERGKSQVLVAGAQGSISNYQMIINHMSQNYIRGKEPVALSEEFRFNNYDLTNNCYVVRKIDR